jgi:hypothetical protein
MIFSRPCPACAAKDAEIGRLVMQIYAANASLDKQAGEVMELARDAAGHSRRAVPQDPPLKPLPDEVQTFLDIRFGYGTVLWRQQARIARKLVDEGKDPLDVTAILSRGKNLDDII